MGCSDWPIGLFSGTSALHVLCRKFFFSRLLKLSNAQEFTLFCFCMGKFLKFQVQLFMQTKKIINFLGTNFVKLQKRGSAYTKGIT